jgi:DNA-binding NtrC family response regulator
VRHNIMFLDNLEIMRRSVKTFLEGEGFKVWAVGTPEEAIALLRQKIVNFSAALVDYHLDDGVKGSEVIREINKINPRLAVIGYSGDDSDPAFVDSMDSGAFGYVSHSKDDSKMKLLGTLHRMCREVERSQWPAKPSSATESARLIRSLGMTGVSPQSAEVARLILKYAPSDLSVLIRGENGTGKEGVAKAIHENSKRRLGPFIAVNCASTTPELIESTFFGHEKGSFTGANSSQIGKFQAANGGTIFLDEIGEMPPRLQTALLRVLQEREITPVGSNKTKKIDVRVIAATNAPLEERIQSGLFRQDLFSRLDVLPITVSPLRDRPDDIRELAIQFTADANAKSTNVKTVTESCIVELQKLPWPGNVRDLEHLIFRLHLLTDGPEIDDKALERVAPSSTVEGKKVRIMDHEVLMQRNDEEERELLALALRLSKHLTGAAQLLRITRSRLRSRMKALEIENPFSDKEEE